MKKEDRPNRNHRHSILIDGLEKEFGNQKRPINGVFYMAKPIGKIINRVMGALRVLIGTSIAVHFSEDDKYLNL